MGDAAAMANEAPKEPIEIVRRGDDEVLGYACGKCGSVVGMNRDLAVKCCGPWHCERCGEWHRDRPYQPYCSPCWSAYHGERQAKREAERFEQAEKIKATEWDGPVYSPEIGYNEGFFRSWEELYEHCDDEGEPNPEYAWACYTRHPSLCGEQLLEQALDDAPEGLDLDAEDELLKFIEEWNGKQTAEIWEPNYKLAVVL